MKSKAKPLKSPQTMNAYLKGVSPDKRAALNRLRATIQAAAPKAEECISYGIPAFRLDGKIMLWFGAAKNHCSLYPGTVIAEFTEELLGFETSKGTIRFQPDHPLPATLVRKLLKARLKRTSVRQRKTK